MISILEQLKSAASVAIILPENASQEAVFSALAIRKSAGNKARLIGGGKDLEKIWKGLFTEEDALSHSIAVHIPSEKAAIEAVRYEKTSDGLTVFLETRKFFGKEDIEVRELEESVELAIMLGFKNKEEESLALAKHVGRSGNVISLSSFNESISSTSALKPLSRLLARGRKQGEGSVFWSFVTAGDFEKEKSTPKTIVGLIAPLYFLSGSPRVLVVLWQQLKGASIEGFFYTKDPSLQKGVTAHYKELFSENVLFLPSYKSFTEAETVLRKLLVSLL